MPRPPEGPKLRPNQKRGGTFYIYWTDAATGRSRERSTGTRDRAEAHQAFAEWLSQRDDGPAWSGPRRAAQATIADVLAMYAIEHAATEIVSREVVRYSIQALLGWWGERTCDHIRPETCRAYVRARVAEGRKQSTAGRELAILRAALGHATKNGKLVDRPFVELPSKQPGRDRWLTRDEAAALLRASRQERLSRGHLPLFILIALATGARPAAIFDLRWTQIDFTNNRIDFNPPGRKRTSKGRPIIPMPRRLRWFLLRSHAQASSPYVLSYAGRQLTTVKDSFRNARIRAGLGDDVVPYTLRHSAGTWLAQAGVDLWVVGGWLGHSQQRTTELYAHHSPHHMAAARKVMD